MTVTPKSLARLAAVCALSLSASFAAAHTDTGWTDADSAQDFISYCKSASKSKAGSYTLAILERRAGTKDCGGIEDAIKRIEKMIINDDKLTDVRALRFFDFKSLALTSKKPIRLSQLAGMDKLTALYVAAPITYLPVIGSSVESIAIIGGKSLNIESVAEYENLSALSLIKTSVDDLGPIRMADKLTSLRVQEAGLKDLADLPLSSELQKLYLAKNEISNIRTLKRLEKLTSLDLSGNRLNSIDALSGLKHLKWLNVSFNPIDSGFDALRDLTKVTYLSITNVGFNELKLIKGMTSLSYLFIGGNGITDLSPLKTYGIAPGTLGIRDNKVVSLAPLASLTGIQRLYANNNKISDLTNLPKKINTLDLSDNDVESLAGVDKLKRLKYFIANNNNIRDLEPLRKAKNLSSLMLNSNQVRTIAPLKELSGIKRFSLAKNPLGVDLPKTSTNCPTDAKSKVIARWCGE